MRDLAEVHSHRYARHMKPDVRLVSSKDDLKAFPAGAMDDTGHQLFWGQRGLDPDDLQADAVDSSLRPGNSSTRLIGSFQDSFFGDSPECRREHRMGKKKVQSVFRDLYPAHQAAEMEMRSLPLQGLGCWLADSGLNPKLRLVA